MGCRGHALRRDDDARVVECDEPEDPSEDRYEHQQAYEQVVSENILHRNVAPQLFKFIVDIRCLLLSQRLHRPYTRCSYAQNQKDGYSDDPLAPRRI